MTTMMEHPQHGRYPAAKYEVERLLELGWTVMPPKIQAPEPAQPAADPVSAPLPGRQPKRRRNSPGSEA